MAVTATAGVKGKRTTFGEASVWVIQSSGSREKTRKSRRGAGQAASSLSCRPGLIYFPSANDPPPFSSPLPDQRLRDSSHRYGALRWPVARPSYTAPAALRKNAEPLQHGPAVGCTERGCHSPLRCCHACLTPLGRTCLIPSRFHPKRARLWRFSEVGLL